MTRPLLGLCFVLACLFGPAAAWADDAQSAQDRAAALKAEGDGAMDSRQYLEALDAYERAFAIHEDPVYRYNAGRAAQRLGRYPVAVRYLEEFRELASPELRKRVPGLDELIEDLKAKVGAIDLLTPVAGAEVVIDDQVIGVTPLDEPIELNAGERQLELRARGHATEHRLLTVEGKKTLRLEIALQRLDRTGVLRVESPEPDAVLSVDGEVRGSPPLELRLMPGEHELVLQEGKRRRKTTVLVAEGKTKSVTVDLPPPSVTRRWWFWTAAGGVVAGSAAITAALLIERDPGSGTISPGRVPGP